MSKIAFVTGANRGIGFETARELAKKGIKVILGSRDAAKGEIAASQLKSEGLDVVAFQFDVNNHADHQKIFRFIEEKFNRLDILVNNAGVYLDGSATVTSISQEILRETFNANFFSVVALTQTLLPLIQKSSAGRIVNLSSILGSLTLQSDPHSSIYGAKGFAYDASKTALNAFTVHLAIALKDTKIKVNSAHPGWVKTDMGGSSAPLEITDGAKTGVQLALVPESGPTGGFYHLGEELPW